MIPWCTNELFNNWGGGVCRKFVLVLGGDGAEIAPTGGIFDQTLGEMTCLRGKIADHVEDHAVLFPEGAVLVASPRTESSYPRPPIVERLQSCSPLCGALGFHTFVNCHCNVLEYSYHPPCGAHYVPRRHGS